ncbi:GRIP and coiled-coil domain-containing protein 1-like [Dysidea avara]|uniref:GRIP and coiled-coil domain-containing protein 1-like n=1 Tax=Dysidea avara TaxID=196820 RepID=UPI00332BE743
MQSLATLSEEKARIETSFQADRKVMLANQEILYKQLQTEREKAEKEHNKLRKQLENLQDLESSLDTHKLMGHKAKEYEQNISVLSQQLQHVTEQLSRAEEQASHPPPLLATLQQEMEQMKEEHLHAMAREQSRVKLKERVSQLDQENTTLTKAHVERKEVDRVENHEKLTNLQERNTRLKKILKIATSKLVDKTVLTNSIEALLDSSRIYISTIRYTFTKECLQQLADLKREFDSFRTRAHSVLKNKDNKELVVGTNQEVKELFEENAELKQQLAEQQAHHEHEMEQSLKKSQQLREDMRSQHEEYQKKIGQAENGYKQKLQELQLRVQSTRERTSTLLQDKDTEINRLKLELSSSRVTTSVNKRITTSRSSFSSSVSTPSTSILVPPVSDDNQSGDNSALSDEEAASSHSHRLLPSRTSKKNEAMSAVKAILNKPVADEEVKLLHFIQEQARRDAEISLARRKCIELEETISDYHEREEKLIEQSTVLKEEIRRLERSRSRETANLEYLKNIILHYMCSANVGKDHMINAIATVLHFSPHEVQLIKQNQSSWWGTT